MSKITHETGYFLFSLDTELAWGHFDCFDPKMFSTDGQRERRSVNKLLDILDEFEIIATWAVVGQLFHEFTEENHHSFMSYCKERYPTFYELYRHNSPLLFGADIIERLLNHGTNHEVAFHGYTHRLFDENTMTEEEADAEIKEWLRISKRRNVTPLTVIFPRGKIGRLDLFKRHGFICYRGEELMREFYSWPLVGRIFRRFHYYLSPLFTPAVYDLEAEPSGMVNLPSSQWLFGFNRKIERYIDLFNLHNLRLQKLVAGVKKASIEKRIIHIWAHPYEFCREKDFAKLRYLFRHVYDEIQRGRLQSIGMADLAKKILE
jgi:peptidoglycan/xylan/chitin deacetylase (PgdA/CDA1 family)